jgi:hypothetical protein
MQFVQNQYDKYDKLGRELLVDFLIYHGWTVEPKEKEDYKVDIIATKEGKTEHFEVEMKNTSFTSEQDFPFSTVSFLERKKKFHKEHYFFYTIISSKTYGALMIRSDKIYNTDYLEVLDINTTERSGTDYFYRVPKEVCRFISPEEFLVIKDNA